MAKLQWSGKYGEAKPDDPMFGKLFVASADDQPTSTGSTSESLGQPEEESVEAVAEKV